MTALSYKIPIGGSWMCDEAVDEPTQLIEPIEEEMPKRRQINVGSGNFRDAARRRLLESLKRCQCSARMTGID